MQSIIRHARIFAGCERGNFGIVFALVAVPVLGIAGMALDYSRISSTKASLQASVDAAITAAAAAGGRVEAMQTTVSDFIAANFQGEGVKVTTTVNSNDMRVEARYMLDLPVLAALGKPQVEITASAEVESAAPLRDGSVQAAPAIGKQDLQRARERFEQMTRRMPREMRDALRRDFENYLKQAQATGDLPASGFHLSQ
jgi:Putative Flp pilus-assembly TadE/G-like